MRNRLREFLIASSQQSCSEMRINVRFAHISDLHLGKRVNEFSMIEDQKYILKSITDIIKKKDADVVFIAGDIYDKAVATQEAVSLFDEFLTDLFMLEREVYIISGNHDSAERLSFGSRIIEKNRIHIAPVFDGQLYRSIYEDRYGAVNIYMLPFIRPSIVRRYYPEKNIQTYEDAVRVVIDEADIDYSRRNIMIAHQFITGAKRTESEEIAVGGLDNISADLFNRFNYTALGHIHSQQKVQSDNIRYCGTPLKYSFSEVNDNKCVLIGEIDGEGCVTIEKEMLKPLRDMRHIKNTYEYITNRENYIGTDIHDYMYITLTDEEEIPDAIGRLRAIYPNIMKLDYDNTRTRMSGELNLTECSKNRSPQEYFEELYFLQNNKPMSKEQEKFISGAIEKIWRQSDI